MIVAGQSSVDLNAAIVELRSRGFARIVSEGGPQLFTDLVKARLVDELCLTRSPTLVAGTETRILRGGQFDPPVELELNALFGTDDGFLYLLYRPAES